MSDPFAKWRSQRSAKAETRTAVPAEPVAIYETTYVSRGWAILLLLAWTPCMVAIIVAMFLNETAIKAAVPYATGLMTLTMLLLMVSLVVVPMGAASRRRWVLWADRLEIVHRPFIPLVGPYRRASIRLDDIAAARMGEALNGMPVLELEAKTGGRYRLAPKHVGKGRNVRLDLGGFEDFVDRIGTTIVAAGFERPPGETLKTASSGITGIVVLAVSTALCGALCLFGVYATFDGAPVGMQALAFGVPLTLIFAGLLRSRWAKWRSGAA